MKKPVVDYRNFRLSRINEPRFSHLKLLAGWIIYFAMYFITENLIPAESCHVVHCRLDDWIPFCVAFVFHYVLWYALVAGSLLYFLLYDVEGFRRLMIFIIVTQVTAMLIYIGFPNRQDLRPEQFPRDNILSRCVGFLYAFDTNTNVCPSLHVAYSLGIASAFLKDKNTSALIKSLVVIFVFLVCLSVAFIKQHSVVDVFAALPVCLLAEIIAYGKGYWLPRLRKGKRT